MSKKRRLIISLIILLLGLFLSLWTYFSLKGSIHPVGYITDTTIHDELVNKVEDSYQNKDEVRCQVIHVKVLSGKHKGEKHTISNYYSPSQVLSQKYHGKQMVLMSFVKNKPTIISPKRDGVIIFACFFVVSLLVLITGMSSISILLSMILNSIVFYFVIKFDIIENGTQTFAIYGTAVVLFTALSLIIVQGCSKKMLVTLVSTLLGVFISFGMCYLLMRLTNEKGIKYEAVDYATQDPRALFLAQTLLGVLGAVMDEATDIVTSLYALCQHKQQITFKELFNSGRTLGQEIMGPLINVLVLIFMAEALPMDILLLRDNNTLAYTCQFALSLGIIQSLVSAIGIVLTVIFSTVCCYVFVPKH